MIRLDSIKLRFSSNFIEIIDPTYFWGRTDMQVGNEQYLLDRNSKILGFNGLQLTKNKETTLKMSSKILKENYKELINKQNIGEVFEKLNSLKIIKVDSKELIKNAEVLSFSVTKDIPVNGDYKVFKIIPLLICSDRFFKHHRGTYTEFRAKNTVYGEKVILYDKYKELNLERNNELRFYIEMNDFYDTLRVEVDFPRKKGFEKYFSEKMFQNKLLLKHLLACDGNELYRILKSVLPLNINKQVFSGLIEKEDSTAIEYVKRLGFQKLLELYKNNPEEVIKFFRYEFGRYDPYIKRICYNLGTPLISGKNEYLKVFYWLFYKILMYKKN